MWGMIATWTMSQQGVKEVYPQLDKALGAEEAVVEAIVQVEDNPYFKSVGYGGLPNKEGQVELDAAFMEGKDLSFGAVGAVQRVKNPIRLAQYLSKQPVNNFLVGEGAERYAKEHGLDLQGMLSERAKIHYLNRCLELEKGRLDPYRGHDTVGMLALDTRGHLAVGTSTSGLFMKEPGRLGDSAVIGSGFYVDDAVGGATATGLGEDLMKGLVSYEIVRLMKEGKSPQEACEQVVFALDATLKKKRGEAGDLSVVAMSASGAWGAASNIDNFSFVVVTEREPLRVYRTKRWGQHMEHTPADANWLEAYYKERQQPVFIQKGALKNGGEA